jgi:hypothetical protein
MPHPLYSPDIAPSDFFLFGYLKDKLQGCSYDSADELFSAITDLMETLEKSLLRCVFDKWILRLHLIVESGGEWWRVYPSITKEFCYSLSSLNKTPSTIFLTPLYVFSSRSIMSSGTMLVEKSRYLSYVAQNFASAFSRKYQSLAIRDCLPLFRVDAFICRSVLMNVSTVDDAE